MFVFYFVVLCRLSSSLPVAPDEINVVCNLEPPLQHWSAGGKAREEEEENFQER